MPIQWMGKPRSGPGGQRLCKLTLLLQKKRKDMCTNTFNYTETLTLVETQTLANFVSSKSYDDIFSIYVLCNARHIL